MRAGITSLAFSSDEAWLVAGLMLSSTRRFLGDATTVARLADGSWTRPRPGHLEGFGAPGEIVLSTEQPRGLEVAKVSDLTAARRIYNSDEWTENFVCAGDRIAILRNHEVIVASSSTGRTIWTLPLSAETFGSMEMEGGRYGGVRLARGGERVALVSPDKVPTGRVEVWDSR